MPTVTILLILNLGSLIGVGFEKVYLMQNPLNSGVSEVISTYVYKRGLIGGEFSFASAVGLMNTAANLAVASRDCSKMDKRSGRYRQGILQVYERLQKDGA